MRHKRARSGVIVHYLPDFGQIACVSGRCSPPFGAVTATGPSPSFGELRTHLVRTTSLTPNEADRVIAEVLRYFDEDVPGFVRRRHRELQARGLHNPQAFERISEELSHRRFVSPALSLRQLRRIVYT